MNKATITGVPKAAMVAAVRSELAAYKAPKRVVFVSEVPRAPNGKADYKAATTLATAAVK